MADSHSARTKAFISYSHADKKYLEKLITHLEYYRRERKLDIWNDRHIPTGAVWEDEIKVAIASAKVAILLVSANFLASKFIANVELPLLLEAAEKDGLVIFSIILSPCAFEDSVLAHYQAINSSSYPLRGMSYSKREATWKKLVEQVVATLESAPPLSEKREVTQKKLVEQVVAALETSPPLSEKPDVSPKTIEQWIEEGRLLYEKGRFAEALAKYKQCFILDPGYAMGYLNCGKAFFALHSYQEALKNYSYAITLDSAFADAYYNRALLYTAKEEYQQAFDDLTHALMLNPAHTVAKEQYDVVRKQVAIKPENFSPLHTLKHAKRGGWKNLWSFADVQCIAFSPDNTLLASGGDDGIIKLWDPMTGQALRTLATSAGVDSVAFSPDGQILAASSSSKHSSTITLWNPLTGQMLRTLTTSAGVNCIAFSPNGQILASNSSTTITLWDSLTGQMLRTLTNSEAVFHIAFSPNGQILASNSSTAITLWDPLTGQMLRTFTGLVSSVAFDYSSEAVGSSDSKPWPPQTTYRVIQTNDISCFAFSPDGQTLASCDCSYDTYATEGYYSSIKLWNLHTEQMTREPIVYYSGYIKSINFSPDGQTLVSSSVTNGIINGDDSVDAYSYITLWNPYTGEELNGFPGGTLAKWSIHKPKPVIFSFDGRMLASVAGEAAIELWRRQKI